MKKLLFWILLVIVALLLIQKYVFPAEVVPEVGVYNLNGPHQGTGITFFPDMSFSDFDAGIHASYIWGPKLARYGISLRYDFLNPQSPIQPYTLGGTGIYNYLDGLTYGVLFYGGGLRIPGEDINFYIEERIDEVGIGNSPLTVSSTTIGFGFDF